MPPHTSVSSTSASTPRTSRRISGGSRNWARSSWRDRSSSPTGAASPFCTRPMIRGWSWCSRARSRAAAAEARAERESGGKGRRREARVERGNGLEVDHELRYTGSSKKGKLRTQDTPRVQIDGESGRVHWPCDDHLRELVVDRA